MISVFLVLLVCSFVAFHFPIALFSDSIFIVFVCAGAAQKTTELKTKMLSNRFKCQHISRSHSHRGAHWNDCHFHSHFPFGNWAIYMIFPCQSTEFKKHANLSRPNYLSCENSLHVHKRLNPKHTVQGVSRGFWKMRSAKGCLQQTIITHMECSIQNVTRLQIGM